MLSSNCFFLFQFIWNCVHAEWVLKMVAPKNWVHILKGLEYREEKTFFFLVFCNKTKEQGEIKFVSKISMLVIITVKNYKLQTGMQYMIHTEGWS